MADGTYERPGPRQAEIARFKRLLAEQAKEKLSQREDKVEECSRD